MKHSFTRRQFLGASLALGSGLALPAPSWARVIGANDTIRIGVIGFNGQGRSHIEAFRKLPGVRVTALCDADSRVLEAEAKKFRDRGEAIDTMGDIRQLLDRSDIDAISTATPNHWHALITVWACQAGKDVYVEKPVSHNVWEGRQAVIAARKYQRIVQTGTQCRSSSGLREAVAWVRQGNLGKIKLVRALCYKRRASIGKTSGDQPVPSSIDYDLWCGPAPKGPLRRSRLHYDWHWVWATGNGDLGNQGIHQMDIARWFLGENRLSPSILSIGGRLGYEDDGETANTQIIIHDYKPVPLIFEVRGLPAREGTSKMDDLKGASIGVIVECEHGYLVNPSYTEATAFDPSGQVLRKFSGTIDHHANFIKAVRSRKVSDLTADILEGHLSSALCHTGNISYLLGRRARPEEIREAIRANPHARETYDRFAAHLVANAVDLEKTPATLGVALQMNPRSEQFKGNARANALVSRQYRPPFVVPRKV
jgi:predicted dehydrogenase